MDDFLPNKLNAKISNFSGETLRSTRNSLQNYLFRSSEPGFTFEPWDITTMYQDRAGTTPVTAAGQSVGLRLDKSKGLALRAELVANGGFDSDTAWSKEASWTISGGTANKTAGAAGSLYQASASIVQGRTYQITFTVSGVSAGTLTPFCRGTVGVGVTASGTYTQRIVAGSDSVYAINFYAGATFTGSIDNISVRELAGNHEVAINDAGRGIYGWMPKTGRRNLLTYTEQFDNAAWTKSVATVTANAAVAPDGTMTADLVAGGGFVRQQYAIAATAVRYTYSIYAKASTNTSFAVTEAGATGSAASFVLSGAGTVVITDLGGSASGTIISVGDGWYRCTFSYTTNGVQTILYLNNTAISAFLWGAQLELGSTATAYQRVVSNYDVTEAGVPSCYYVLANGVNTAYSTPTITPGTDKAQMFAGVRRLVDTAGVMIEHSADWNANDGSFLFFGGSSGTGTGAGFLSGSRGNAPAAGVQFAISADATLTPPVSAVVTGLHDIAAPLSTSRANGFSGTSTAAKGTGNFLAYPAYIYSRGGTSLPFNGLDFGHAVRFGPNLDAATIARVEALIARNTPEVTL